MKIQIPCAEATLNGSREHKMYMKMAEIYADRTWLINHWKLKFTRSEAKMILQIIAEALDVLVSVPKI